MKRFTCAIIVLLITIIVSFAINNKIYNSTNEIILMIDNDLNIKNVREKWEKEKLLYSLIFSQSDIEKIQLSFDNAETDKNKVYKDIKDGLTTMNDSIKYDFENIF